jgi:DNA-binding Lrp family transcriptional regulator
VVAEPYRAVAAELGIETTELVDRLGRMIELGIIRRIAAVPNHYALGYTANGMSVWDVADEEAEALGQAIASFDFVSHCYQRPRHLPIWPYNLFAMVHGRRRDDVLEQVERISQLLGDRVRSHDVLFSTRILKKTGLRIVP